MKIYQDIGESMKILGAVSDLIELMGMDEDSTPSKETLLGAAYVMNEALADIVKFQERSGARWKSMRDELESMRERAA